MYKTYNIDACHSVARRIIEHNLEVDAFAKLLKELEDAGYEDIQITANEYYQEGDEIKITQELYDSLPDKVDRNHDDYIKEMKKYEAKKSLHHIFGNPLELPITGKVIATRQARDLVTLSIKWDDANKGFETTNTYFLEYIGFQFKQPEDYEVIDLIKADDSILSIYEQILKRIMICGDMTEEEARKVIEPVHEQMKDIGAVFYIP